MTATPINTTDELHPALRAVVEDLHGAKIDVRHPHWVEFDALGTLVIANVKEGGSQVRIRSYFLDDAAPDELDSVEWAGKQPKPQSGLLEIHATEIDGEQVDVTRLVFERPIASPMDRLIESDIALFAQAWTSNGITQSAPVEGAQAPPEISFDAPQNAWLLLADELAYPKDDDLKTYRDEGAVGICSNLWTVAKNSRVGDLVLIYFVAPHKSAVFVARQASNPFWSDQIEVNAESGVRDQQWWAFLTPLVEIEPISATDITKAHGGHFVFKGRSGRYLVPAAFEHLQFLAKNPADQELVDRIAAQPSGLAELPSPGEITFAQWQNIASGVLRLEADVSNYIVEPLLRWAMEQDRLITRIHDGYAREVRIGPDGGYADFVLNGTWNDGSRPRLVVEVKLAIQHPKSGVWTESPDFRQLRRYMDHLDVPGLLIDTQNIFIVDKGADKPAAHFLRAEVRHKDLMDMLRYLPIGGSSRLKRSTLERARL